MRRHLIGEVIAFSLSLSFFFFFMSPATYPFHTVLCFDTLRTGILFAIWVLLKNFFIYSIFRVNIRNESSCENADFRD